MAMFKQAARARTRTTAGHFGGADEGMLQGPRRHTAATQSITSSRSVSFSVLGATLVRYSQQPTSNSMTK